MAIPPIISNLSLFKLFKTDNAGNEAAQNRPAESPAPGSTSDIVDISEAAQKKLQGIEKLSADNPDKVHDVAEDTRDILQENEGTTLGLDPGFS